MDKWSDYGDEEQEDWGNPHDPYDMAGTEMKPEALPLEAIIEENSVIKDSPEQTAPAKAPTKPPIIKRARVASPTGKAMSPTGSRKRSSDGFKKKQATP